MQFHIVTSSVAAKDLEGRLLLVRTYWRNDTWEIPGGQVEAGEDLIHAGIREVEEESGMTVAIVSLAGIYHNLSRNIVNFVFRGVIRGGSPRPSPETSDVKFVEPHHIPNFVTRPQFLVRVEDAMREVLGPRYCVFTTDPWKIVHDGWGVVSQKKT